MRQQLEIQITGGIPDDNHSIGALAHVAAIDPVKELVDALAKVGLTAVTHSIRAVRVNVPKPEPVAPKGVGCVAP